MKSEDMYKRHILELYKNPKNFGKIENATNKKTAVNPIQHTEENTFCGDEITIYLVVKNDKIENVKFTGEGCAISIASASLLTDKIKGMNVEDVKKMDSNEVLKLLKIDVNPGRIKCALLPLEAVKKSLKKGWFS
ncbi:Fe-S cluster protein [Candidatus Pacearchaeota archaeon CG10_big_fil_rev_8_21_14_0_10_34_12]|nr:MAG: Fe-S cluster protein [Candidatus Pacearchaeota archaeon CG10_big_fil_rev_8_21_14_0_10_34_12]